ncbi:hypothetical protein SH139x_002766 [Planctomycetaceae bacterium SH139]
MSDKFQPVTSGQPLRLPAATWNAMLDAARAHEQSKFDRKSGVTDGLRQPTLAKVRNQTGQARNQFDVVGLIAPLVGPGDNFSEFQRQATFSAGLPVAGGAVGILTEPLAAGAIGTAVVAGVIAARVAVSGTVYDCAEPLTGTSNHLRSVPHGPFRVLWIEQNGLPLRWAMVRFDDSNQEEVVYITSNHPDEDGFYPGIVQRYDVSSGDWGNRFPCKVLDANA